MKTVYVLWNYDTDEPIFSSTDKAAVEEIMCDLFFEDAYDQFCWEIFRPYILNIPTYTPKKVADLVNNVFEDTMDWYDNYMGIIEIIPVWD